MKSYTTLRNMFGSLSQNTSSTNLTLGDQLINDAHRYLLLKYFNNETSYSISTIGSQSLTATASLSAGDTSCTLTAAWAYHTTNAYITFSNGDIRYAYFTAGSTSVTWSVGLTAAATTALAVGGVQFYPAPPNFSKLKTLTIMIGALKWTPTEILTREEWDRLNVFPYYADIPNNYFIYPGGDHGGQFGIWPIPSTTGNIITYSYKYRVPDLSIADYNAGTVSVNNKSTAITGSGTAFTPTTNVQNESRWIQIAQTAGDNLWYQLQSVDSATGASLFQPYQGINVSGGSYTIGQMPILNEDFHDMIVYRALSIYFASIVKDVDKFKMYEGLYNERLKLLEEYCGTKTVNVNLGRRPINRNPNLFQQNNLT